MATDVLVYELTGLPDGLSSSDGLNISGEPEEAGTSEVFWRVSDSNSNTTPVASVATSDITSFMIIVGEAPPPPRLTGHDG